MSEDFENEEVQEDEGLQKSVSLGLKPHPITSEMGVIMSIGNEQTWLSFGNAKRLVGDIDLTIMTGVAFGTMINLAAKMPEAPKEIFRS
jgi:hypothetical protein